MQKYTFRLIVNGNRSHRRQQCQEHHKRFDDPTLLSTEGIRVAVLTVLGWSEFDTLQYVLEYNINIKKLLLSRVYDNNL